MRCPRCQAELPDSANTCTQCGAAVRQSAIQPFSYLPAGAPPWPTSIPQRPGPKASTAIQEIAATAEATSAGPKRSAKSILAIIGVLVLVPVLGSLFTILALPNKSQPTTTANIPPINTAVVPQATPSEQVTQQLPTPSSFKDLSNSDVNVALQYPSDWQVENPQKTQSYASLSIHPTQQLGIDLGIVHLSATESANYKSANDLNQSQILSFNDPQNGLSNAKVNSSSAKQKTIGNSVWSQIEGSFNNSNSIQFHVLAASVQRNNTYYLIMFSSPETYYQDAVNKYLDHMLQSFKFLS